MVQLVDVSGVDDYLGPLTGEHSNHGRLKEAWATVEQIVQLPTPPSQSEQPVQKTSESAEESCLPKSEITIFNDFTPALLAAYGNVPSDKLRRFDNFLQVCPK